MKCKINSTKESWIKLLLETIAEVDIKKGELLNINCAERTIEWTVPECEPIGTLD